MTQLARAIFVATSLAAAAALAGEAEVFDFKSEIARAGRHGAAANRFLVKMPEYTVSAVVVRDEIPTHQHDDGGHVLYIVSGRGTVTLEGKTVPLKPGLVLHIPQGVVHSIKARGGQLTFVDFVQHAHDPAQAERAR